jgi:hypothetical protein
MVAVMLFLSSIGIGFSEEQKQTDYQTYVANILDACRADKGGIFAFPELEKYYRLLFESNSVGVRLRSASSDGTAVTRTETNIYFQKGNLYVRCVEGPKGTNLVTTDKGVYSWIDGESSGEILRAVPADQAQYFTYLLDPSAIMKSLFHNYLTTKKAKNVTPDTIELETVADGGVWNVLLSKRELWFLRLTVMPPEKYSKPGSKSETNFDLIGTNITIPTDILAIPEGITWKESDMTVASKMAWL